MSHIRESCHTSHINKSRHTSMSHVTYQYTYVCTYKYVMSHTVHCPCAAHTNSRMTSNGAFIHTRSPVLVFQYCTLR